MFKIAVTNRYKKIIKIVIEQFKKRSKQIFENVK